jgi:hypothetical protein
MSDLPELPEPAYPPCKSICFAGPDAPEALYTADQLTAYAKQVREQALEAVLAIIEREKEAHRMFRNHQASLVLANLAVDVRALTEKQ